MPDNKRPVNAETMRMMEANAREIGAALGRALERMPGGKKEFGFTLLLFSYEGPEITYISSAERDGMKKTMLELLAKWEGGMPDQTWDQRS
jgi:hypothetical protein